MRVRRITSGQTSDGKSRIVRDEFVASTSLPTGFVTELWGGDSTPALPNDGTAPTYESFFPPHGGYRFLLNQILPDALSSETHEQRGQPSASPLRPGALESLEEGEHAGMHTSDSVDFIVVISGVAGLELDDGEKVLLSAGDSFIQNGTRHRWFNPGSEPANFVAVMLGGRRG